MTVDPSGRSNPRRTSPTAASKPEFGPGLMRFLLSRSFDGRTVAEVWRGSENLKRHPALNGVARRWRILCRNGAAEEIRALQRGYAAYRLTPRGLALADIYYLEEKRPLAPDDPDT